MFIKFEWPVKIIIFGNKEGEMEPEINFVVKNFKCKAYFNSISYLDKPYVEIKGENGINNYKYFSRIKTITFEVVDDNANILKDLIKNKKLLLEQIILILNKVLKCLRIFGWAHNVHEYSPKYYEENVDFPLIELDVHVSEDGKNFNNLIDEFEKWKMFGITKHDTGFFHEYSYIFPPNLSKIEDAIADKNLDIIEEEEPIETEFWVNSREHQLNKNYRLSIIESVIAVEIALTSYIRDYFKCTKKYNKKKIDKFLNANFDLSTRLYIIPALTLSDDDNSKINFDLVLKAVGLRNKLIHKGEDCLSGVSENEINNYINEINKLSRLLSLKALQMKTKPKMRDIAEKIRTKFRVGCVISRLRNHRFIVTIYFTFSIEGVFFEENKVIDIINTISELLAEYDKNIILNEHLIVNFRDISDMKLWAYWKYGKTITLQK